MKKHFIKAIIAITAFVAVSQTQAYFYNFVDLLDRKIAVAIKFKGSRWYEFCVINPGEMGTIGHGNKYIPDVQSEFPSASAGLIPSQIFYYFPKPGERITIENQQKVAWKPITITWLPSEAYERAIKLAKQLGSTGEQLAKVGAQAGMDYMTGGAATATNKVGEGAKKAAGSLSSMFSTTKEKEAASTTEKSTTAAASSTNYNLSKLLGAIGASAARSLIGDHHFEIVEDETGKISFISEL